MPAAKRRRTATGSEHVVTTTSRSPSPEPSSVSRASSPIASKANPGHQPALEKMHRQALKHKPKTSSQSTAGDQSQAQEPATEVGSSPSAPPKSPAKTANTADNVSAAAAAAAARMRLDRFKELRARAKQSSESNLQAASAEAKRMAADPAALAAIQRKAASATQKLLRVETEEAGEDFERKRAWDWTIDEAETWDRHVRRKAEARDGVAFRDYRDEAAKVYDRQLRHNLPVPDLARYDAEKLAAVERAARSGEVDLVETADGQIIAVDKVGRFFADEDDTAFAQHKPDKEAIKRVMADVNKADEQRLKKRRERMAKNGDDGDVTYINEKNKQFNQKLERFYNKYTAEIRESFERGTMI